jgi:transposase-like protein
VIHSDDWRGYNGLVGLGYKKHFRVNHGQDQFVHDKSHINGIECFWGYTKARLARFRGLNKKTFYLHLKECVFRFNNRGKSLYLLRLETLRKPPLF